MKQLTIGCNKSAIVEGLNKTIESYNNNGYQCTDILYIYETDFYTFFLLTFECLGEAEINIKEPFPWFDDEENKTDGKSCLGCVHFDPTNNKCSIRGLQLKKNCEFRTTLKYANAGNKEAVSTFTRCHNCFYCHKLNGTCDIHKVLMEDAAGDCKDYTPLEKNVG